MRMSKFSEIMLRIELYSAILCIGVFLTFFTYRLIVKKISPLIAQVLFQGINILFPLAVKAKNERLVRWLIKAGADVNACNDDGKTALHLLFEEEAAHSSAKSLWLSLRRLFSWEAVASTEMGLQRRVRIAKLLIQHGADVSAPFYADQTPHGWAKLHSDCNRPLIKLFLDHGADVNKLNGLGRNVAQQYIVGANYSAYLLHNRGGIEPAFLELIRPSESYTTPLHEYCIFHKSYEIRNETILLAVGDINAEDSFGNTPLYYAVLSRGADSAEDRKSTVNMLLRLGADINQEIIVRAGEYLLIESSILELAMFLRDRDIVEILLKHAAKLVDLEYGDEKKALSEFNRNYIHNLKSDLKEIYLEYAEELREIRKNKLMTEGQSEGQLSLSDCSIWFKKFWESTQAQ